MDLTEQTILSKGGKNTQKNYTKKDFNDPDNHNGVITHLEPHILECEVKWTLRSITTEKKNKKKASLRTKLVEVMEFQLSYFKSWKMMLLMC